MHHILTPRTMWRIVAVRPLLVGITVPAKPPVALCCCVLRLSPPLPPPSSKGRHWLSTSASSRAPLQPKHQPPQEKPQSSSSTHPLEDLKDDAGPVAGEVDPLQDKSIGLFQRFKKTFKQYGKVMIPLHLVTSSIWFGSFYYAAMK